MKNDIMTFDFATLFNATLQNAIKPDLSDYTQTFDSNGTEMTISRKEYTLVNSKGKTTKITVNDPAVIASLESYKSAERLEGMAMYVKAKSLANMADHIDTLSAMGFKTVGDFAHHVLGISKLTANQYARVGRYFLGNDYLPLDCFPSSIEVGKLIEFLAYVIDENGNFNPDEVRAMYADGTLVDGMTTKVIREKLAAKYKMLPAGDAKSSESKSSEKKSSESKSSEGKSSEGKPTFIDAIESMDKTQAAAAILSTLEALRAMLGKFGDSSRFDLNSIYADLEKVADVARAMVDAE